MPKKITKKIKCPHCGKEQTTVIEWQAMSVGYEHDLTTGNSREIAKIAGNFEGWACNSCGKDLPFKMHAEIRKILGM